MLLALCIGPMAAGIIAYCIGRRNKTVRDYFADIVTVLETVLIIYLSIRSLKGGELSFTAPYLCGLGLSLKLDGFRMIYGLVAALMWTCTVIFSREYMAHYPRTNRYYMFFLATMGATVGVFLSADLFTTFLFFEIMSFTSYTWVAHDETRESLRAAETYLAVAVIGGMVMLLGLFFLYNITGTLVIDDIYDAVSMAVKRDPLIKSRVYTVSALMLTGFAAKAGMFPLHIWLPKAHPVAPAPASALLSGILTKSGIFGVLIISTDILRYDKNWGFMILVFGVITMFGGALLGIFSINLKRTLACSSMSQIGFILVGIGMQGLLAAENGLAVRGTILHMVNHSIIKLVLFMCAGVVYMNLHELNLNKIRGYGRSKYFLMICFLAGGLSISGIPGFSGYLSKTLLHESIVEYMEVSGAMRGTYKFIEYVFLLTGGMTLAYMLKLFVAVFIESGDGSLSHVRRSPEEIYMAEDVDDGSDRYGRYLGTASRMAILIPTIMLLILGFMPYKVSDRIAALAFPFMHGQEHAGTIAYFSPANLKGSVISVALGIIIYLVVVRKLLMREEEGKRVYIDAWPKWLDIENIIYRPLLQHIIPFILAFVLRILDRMADHVISLIHRTLLREVEPRRPLLYGNAFTHVAGVAANRLSAILNRTIRRKNPKYVNYEEKLAFSFDEALKTVRLTSRSVSFGLMMFSIGCIFTLVYLIIVLLLHVK